ncbi:acyclic terpene utilization AtuA family protein, partial [Stenotrophomonas maltophilia]|uniref:acyclic terpene utilization AtuA family protein n=1 Tax=Stenotrophomonas maltophilia TaxID=40324 RepID=UPI0013D90409
FTGVRLEAAGADRVAVRGGHGAARTGQLKVSVGYRDGFIGEGQISYAGAGAFERAALAREIVEQRLALTGLD